MKKILAFLICVITLTLSGCNQNFPNQDFTHTDKFTTLIVSEPFKETEVTQNFDESVSSETSDKAINYKYQPTDSIKSVSWYHDEIIKAVSYDVYTNNEILPETTDNELLKSFYDILPQKMVDEVILVCNRNSKGNPFRKDTDKVWDMSYMKFDLNSDGTEDYLLNMRVGTPDFSNEGALIDSIRLFYNVYKAVLMKPDGTFKVIDIPLNIDLYVNVPWYLLSSETNGLKDILVAENGNNPVLHYDGNIIYGGGGIIDESHTFIGYDVLQNNILHINMKVSVIDADVGEYYTIIYVKDNPYLKNNKLYTSYSDGTPKSYLKKPTGEWKPDDFNPGIDGYDFYVELKDGVELPDNYYFSPNEIRYIPVE